MLSRFLYPLTLVLSFVATGIEAAPAYYFPGPLAGFTESYRAYFGNHSGVTICITPAIEPIQMSVDAYSYMDFASSYTMDLATGVVTHTSDREGREGQPERTSVSSAPTAAGYANLVRSMRRWFAFAVKGDFILKQPPTTQLNNGIDYLNGVLKALGDNSPNCVLYERPQQGGAVWTSFGGAFTNLGWWDNRTTSVWIRDGYEVALYGEPGFLGTGEVLYLSAPNRDEQRQGDGIVVDLKTRDFAEKMSSFSCTADFTLN